MKTLLFKREFYHKLSLSCAIMWLIDFNMKATSRIDLLLILILPIIWIDHFIFWKRMYKELFSGLFKKIRRNK